MRTHPIQMNFTNGEISPRLFGRSDLQKYWNSLETLENFIILPYGGAARRDGLHYVVPQKTQTRKARLIPFIFSTEQAYVVEIGHEYMRFYMNHGQIQETADADTVLLLHMNGTNASQTFIDSSNSVHTVSTYGTAQIYTDIRSNFAPLFGGACGVFYGDAHEAYLTVADHADFDWSSDDIFTIETNVFMPYTLGTYDVMEQSIDVDNRWKLTVWTDGHVTFGVRRGTAIGGMFWQFVETSSGAITADTWHHIRVVGDGVNYYLFVNGELLITETITHSMQNFTKPLQIGRSEYDLNYYAGYLDELRISGVARSIANFAPPTQEYPLSVGTPYELASPYLEKDLESVKLFQSYDTMYLFHPDHAWRKLTRSSHSSWALTEIDHLNGPWLDEKSDIVFTPDGTTGSIGIEADASFFVSGHVGALLRLKINGNWGYVEITTVTDPDTAVATVIETLDAAAASDSYQEGAWSTYRGFPSCGAFNEESLVTAANDNQPQTVWASVKGDFENFEAGTDDADAFIYTIPARNRILWLGSLKELVFGTGEESKNLGPIEVNKGPYSMTGGQDDFISPTNVRVRPGTANVILYWQKGGLKLRELTYDPQSFDERYIAPDLSILADHITFGGIRYSAWQQEPYSLLWSVRVDGVMPTMTYMRPEEIVGWARQITDGEIESVAVIPDPTDKYNEVWVSVMRLAIETPDADTVLALRFEGLDGETSFLDSSVSAHTVTPHGSAQLDTALSKFGESSGKFIRADQGFLTVPAHADFDWSSDDIFTIETFIYFESVSAGWVAAQNLTVYNTWEIYISDTGAVQFNVKQASVEQQITTGTGVITNDTWHHIRVVGDGATYYLFVDGILLDSAAITSSMPASNSALTIGADVANIGQAGTYLTAWLDDFKVSVVARSTDDFIVPVTNLEEKRYIEYMDPNLMVDSGLTYSGAAVSSVSGLSHIEGKLVAIVGDGVSYDRIQVTDGAVAISPPASEIQVGLPYTSKLVTVKPIINSERGTTAGKPKKWAEAWVSVHETSGLTINDEVIDFRQYADEAVSLGDEIPLYTGNIRVSQLGWGDGRITLEHDDPLPCTILGIFGTLEIGEG